VQKASRLYFTPSLYIDQARKKKYYFYTPKKRLPKGANKYCTQMLHVLRALKVPHLRSSPPLASRTILEPLEHAG
jgi:hypothetical protein